MSSNLRLLITICILFVIELLAFNLQKYSIKLRYIEPSRNEYSNNFLVSPRKYCLHRYTFRNLKLNDENDIDDDDDDDDDDDFIEKRLYPNTKPKRKIDSRAAVFSGKSKWQVINRAILAGMFIAGIGTGIISYIVHINEFISNIIFVL